MNRLSSLGIAMAVSVAAMAVNPKPFTVPEVMTWNGGEGSFKILPTTAVYADSNQPEALAAASRFAADWKALTGASISVTSSYADIDDIRFAIRKNRKANPESYTINITGKGVIVEAPTANGLRHAASTLMQIAELSGDKSLPIGKISDSPAYRQRGLMLDVGRKYFPIDYLYKLVDVLAYYKMNTLHLHLNDNGYRYLYDYDWDKTPADFRMESEYFPELTSRDGSYGKDEFRKFANYAASRGVEIIPEFDFPAHSLAFTRLRPELAAKKESYGKDHLDLANPQTYEFLDSLIYEYIGGENPVFPGPHFHIGTDEYSNEDSVTVEQFRALTDRYLKYVEKLGKNPMCWGALTHAAGNTPVKSDNVTMYCWHPSFSDPREMVKLGYDIVSIPDELVYIVPEAGYYFNYLDAKKIYETYTPAYIGDSIWLEEGHPQIRGGMFAVWNDQTDNCLTVKDVHHRIMSALPAMSAKTWTADKVTIPYEQFKKKSHFLSEAPTVNELARWSKEPAEILNIAGNIALGTELPIPEVGYSYEVEFDIEGEDETPGTKLFESPNAVFWLSDPISGHMGFSREGKLSTFRHDVRKGDKLHVKIAGDNRQTSLYVNGKLIDNLNIRRMRQETTKKGRRAMAEVHTLVFPLTKAGQFNSKISNLRVSQSDSFMQQN